MSCQDFPWPQRGKSKHIIDMKQLVEWLAYAGFMILAVVAWIWVITAFFCAIMGGTGIIE
jgi:hypothetical protein